MKAFWIKVINLAVICVILFVYQTQARSNAKISASLDSLKEQLGVSEESAEEQEEENSDGIYEDGAYEGTGTGYKGDIRVMVTVEDGRITGVEILETADDPAYFNQAAELTADIIEKQTTEGVDAVSGATFSSNGFLEAVADALKGAEK